jgi:hypothetical protein
MSRNESSVTMTEMRGHDAEIGGHDAPKYAAGAGVKETRPRRT